MKNKSAIIDIRNLSVIRGIPILQNIDWTVHLGEHWAILGANGSGKTTLLNVLMAYMWPSVGEIFVFGQQYGCADWRELRKSIGVVSSGILQRIHRTETALETVVTGQEAIINAWGKISSVDKRRALAILKSVECAALKDRAWQFLSQGERQRVLFGRALMAKLRLLILDEPCAGLDPSARQKFLDFIRRFLKDRRAPTLVFVTHHVEEIVPEITHVLVLKKSRILAAGLKKDILTNRILSDAFEAKIKVKQQNKRFSITVRP